ncbi:NAD-dependent epimerase/dehydratase family protein [Companilactobacillus huachuanensis]|uniref:NAD-dependent epimerase/dehydratase family protein n=1 Tax=Companilactobacillus huachuanensis TaxID=2559914 RepID=A0ABW1RN41_9LACO|nr:NAD-dependent epimerase/dehydratase family protein [Companilactobacillus huachuanensis]
MKKVLVTGGTGFLGLQIILQLLNKGYDVRTTIRKDNGQDRILKVLQANNVKNISKLSFIKADLSSDDNWIEAMQDRDGVFSVASPVFFDKPKNEMDAIRPALNGTMRILKAANESGIKRVVMTSNFGAVGFSKKAGLTTEDDWTDENQVGLSIYEKSKLLAEKAAWNYVNKEDVNLELVTVNPVAIFGPSLDAHVSGSFDLLKNLLSGKMNRIPNLPLNVVDVRDVADIQIRAMETPQVAGQRFIASADGQISMREIATLIQQKRPQAAGKVSSKSLPDWIMNVGSLFNETAKEGKLMKNMNRNVSNQKAKQILGWKPLSNSEEAVLGAVDSLIKYE